MGTFRKAVKGRSFSTSLVGILAALRSRRYRGSGRVSTPPPSCQPARLRLGAGFALTGRRRCGSRTGPAPHRAGPETTPPELTGQSIRSRASRTSDEFGRGRALFSLGEAAGLLPGAAGESERSERSGYLTRGGAAQRARPGARRGGDRARRLARGGAGARRRPAALPGPPARPPCAPLAVRRALRSVRSPGRAILVAGRVGRVDPARRSRAARPPHAVRFRRDESRRWRHHRRTPPKRLPSVDRLGGGRRGESLETLAARETVLPPSVGSPRAIQQAQRDHVTG